MFPSALAGGSRVSSAHFSVVLPKDAKGYAVVVSKKVARLSITRHRIKRRVREALKTLNLPPSLIVFPTSAAAKMEYEDMRSELSRLLSGGAA